MKWTLPRFCLLCLDRSDQELDLCAACTHELPWITHGCYRCALPIERDMLLCGRCQQRPKIFERSIACFAYQQPIRLLISQYKFQHHLPTGRLLGDLLFDQIRKAYRADCLPDFLLAVPLHDRRTRERGFNQAHEIAKHLSRKLSVPLLKHDLKRRKYTAPQSGLSHRKRQRNLRNAFVMTTHCHGLHIAIIDDVMTTGETAFSLGRTLKRQGAARIDLWTSARTVLTRA